MSETTQITGKGILRVLNVRHKAKAYTKRMFMEVTVSFDLIIRFLLTISTKYLKHL